MDVLIFYPMIFQKGGGDRVVLEIAKKFNAPVYTAFFRKETAFSEFSEIDVRLIKQPLFEKPFFFLKGDFIAYGSAIASMKFLTYKIKEDYDVISALGTPGNWIRNNNERVCWYFFAPIRGAYDLYKQKVSILPFQKRVMRNGMFAYYKFWEKIIDPKLEKIVSVSPYVLERDKKFIDEFIKKPVEPVPPGVDEQSFRNDGYEKYFFYPSRLVPEKRFEHAIEAFREFSKKEKGWKLVLAGFLPPRGRETHYIEKLRALCLGLDVVFKIDPSEEELRTLYANAYAVLFYGIQEDWGLTPLESMASEKPCISINEGGPRYTIVEGETGFLVNSPQEMAERMLYLAQNPDRNETMGKAGRKRVLQNYTWKIFMDKMEAAFKEVAMHRKSGQ